MNDLKVSGFQTWKYMDDTNVGKVIPQGQLGNIRSAVHAVENWLCDHKMTLNAYRCKVRNTDFEKNRHAFQPVIFDGKELSVVNSAMILGVTLDEKISEQLSSVSMHT